MRRSRRNGQLWRVASILPRSQRARRISSRSPPARETISPNGPATKEFPQNLIFPSRPTRFTDATYTPLATACERWISSQAARCCCATARGQTRALGKPLVPAHQRSDFRVTRLKAGKAQIARREIKFLVVKRIVGNVHLAVNAGNRAVGVDDHRGVVINPGGAALEERSDDHDLALARERAQGFR